MTARIQSIVWAEGPETVTCTVGEAILMESSELPPGAGDEARTRLSRRDRGTVTRIEDAGACYFVWHDVDDGEVSEWPPVLLVSKTPPPSVVRAPGGN